MNVKSLAKTTPQTSRRIQKSAYCSSALTVLCLSVALALPAQDVAAERSNPLTIHIPSLPENTPEVELIDNDLAVNLLDVQLEAPKPKSLKIVASPSASTLASGQVTIGNTRRPVNQQVAAKRKPIQQIPSERKAIRQTAPSVVLSRGGPSGLPNPSLLTADTSEPRNNSSALPSPQLLTSSAPAPSAAPAPLQLPLQAALPTLAPASGVSPVAASAPAPTIAPAPIAQAAPTPVPVEQPTAPAQAIEFKPVEYPTTPVASAVPAPRELGRASRITESYTAQASVQSFLSHFPVFRPGASGRTPRIVEATARNSFASIQPAQPIAMPFEVKTAESYASAGTLKSSQQSLGALASLDALSDTQTSNAMPASHIANAPVAPPISEPVATLANAELAKAEALSDLAPAAYGNVEPVALSRQSKHVISHIPSKIDSPKKATQKISIERENKTPLALMGDGSELSASHESVGMKIEIRRPVVSLNDELQHAYDAVLSGQNELALAGYERALKRYPRDLNALYGKATLLHQAGNFEAAREYYHKVLTRDPDHREALNNFLSLVAEESPREALHELVKLQKKSPNFSPIPAQISSVYQRMGDYSSAVAAMQDAYSLAPNNLSYVLNMAVLLDRHGAKAQAAPYYQQLVDSHLRGGQIPGNIEQIQERLTFIRSNR